MSERTNFFPISAFRFDFFPSSICVQTLAGTLTRFSHRRCRDNADRCLQIWEINQLEVFVLYIGVQLRISRISKQISAVHTFAITRCTRYTFRTFCYLQPYQVDSKEKENRVIISTTVKDDLEEAEMKKLTAGGTYEFCLVFR